MPDPSAARPGTFPAGISRRKIIQNVAWTTPVILLATAAPAVAASGAVGNLRTSSIGGSARHSGGPNRYVFAHATVTCEPQDPEFSGLVLRFGFDSSLVGSQMPHVVAGTNWQFSGETISGGVRYLIYSWTGTPLSGSYTSTTECSIRVLAHGHGSFSTQIHFSVSATSLGATVSPPEQTLNVQSS